MEEEKKKDSTSGCCLLAAIGGIILVNLIFILVVLAIMGYFRGSMSGSGWLTSSSGGTGGGGGATGGGGTGSCTWTEVKKDSPGTNLTPVTVPVWRYVSQNQKIPGTKSLQVHRNCVESIRAIFNQIYNSGDRPPIKTSDTGCYSNRGAGSNSRHNWGVACDINWIENYCWYKSGGLCGPPGHWQPGDITPDKNYAGWTSGFDILSIPINSTITQAFNGQNWGRGLWRSKNDFMHYSVDGH